MTLPGDTDLPSLTITSTTVRSSGMAVVAVDGVAETTVESVAAGEVDVTGVDVVVLSGAAGAVLAGVEDTVSVDCETVVVVVFGSDRVVEAGAPTEDVVAMEVVTAKDMASSPDSDAQAAATSSNNPQQALARLCLGVNGGQDVKNIRASL